MQVLPGMAAAAAAALLDRGVHAARFAGLLGTQAGGELDCECSSVLWPSNRGAVAAACNQYVPHSHRCRSTTRSVRSCTGCKRSTRSRWVELDGQCSGALPLLLSWHNGQRREKYREQVRVSGRARQSAEHVRDADSLDEELLRCVAVSGTRRRGGV